MADNKKEYKKNDKNSKTKNQNQPIDYVDGPEAT